MSPTAASRKALLYISLVISSTITYLWGSQVGWFDSTSGPFHTLCIIICLEVSKCQRLRDKSNKKFIANFSERLIAFLIVLCSPFYHYHRQLISRSRKNWYKKRLKFGQSLCFPYLSIRRIFFNINEKNKKSQSQSCLARATTSSPFVSGHVVTESHWGSHWVMRVMSSHLHYQVVTGAWLGLTGWQHYRPQTGLSLHCLELLSTLTYSRDQTLSEPVKFKLRMFRAVLVVIGIPHTYNHPHPHSQFHITLTVISDPVTLDV